MRARDFRRFVKSEPETGPPKIRARDALNQKSELDNLIKSNKSGYTGFRGDPKTWNGGMTERRNGGKSPQILKRGTAENHP